MTIKAVETAIEQVHKTVVELMKANPGARPTEVIRNERYYHHMFSSFFMKERDWTERPLLPEEPTGFNMRGGGIAADGGRQGNIDFVVNGGKPAKNIAIEWKGPNNTEQGLKGDFLKLLHQDMARTAVFAAFYLINRPSSRHIDSVWRKLRGVPLGKAAPSNKPNLHVYACSYAWDEKQQPIFFKYNWGKVEVKVKNGKQSLDFGENMNGWEAS